MESDKTTSEMVRASLVALAAIAVFGGLLVLLEWAQLALEGASGDAIGRDLSRFSQTMAPWVFLAAGFVAGLYLRSLLLRPIATVSLLANVYFLLLSFLFHGLAGALTGALVAVQVQTFLLGLVLLAIALGLGGLTERAKGRWGASEGG